MEFYVASKKDLRSIDELQILMMSLCPGIMPERTEDFQEFGADIEFGKIVFVEDIGEESIYREIILTDESMFSTHGFTGERRVVRQTRRLLRWIRIILYPNAEVAALAAEKNYHRYSMPIRELKEYGRQKKE